MSNSDGAICTRRTHTSTMLTTLEIASTITVNCGNLIDSSLSASMIALVDACATSRNSNSRFGAKTVIQHHIIIRI